MRGGSPGVVLATILLALVIFASAAPPVRAPPLPPFEAFGFAQDDAGVALPANNPIRTFIDGVDYSNLTATYRVDGAYAVQVAGNYYVGGTSETPSIKEGGDPGNNVMFVHGDLTTSGEVFQQRAPWTSGEVQNIDLAWAIANKQPGLVKIFGITTRPGDGLAQYAYVCNPTNTVVNLANYYVQKDIPGSFVGPVVFLTGTVGAGSRTFVNLGSTTYLGPNGDVLKLVFRNPGGAGASNGGLDVVVDRVEFNATGGGGALTWEPGNTIMSDAPAPGIGEEIRRNAACADTNAGSDFAIGPEEGRAPVVSVTAPAGRERWSGGSPHEIRWNMSDFEDANTALTVDVAYSTLGGTDGFPNAIVADRQGTANPNVLPWSVPTIDSDTVRIRVCGQDTDGLVGCGESVLEFVIDSTAPTLLSTIPANLQGNVAPDQDITIVFSESLNRASVESAFSIAPDPGPATKTFLWSNTTFLDDTVTIPLNILAVGTIYTVVVDSTGTDLSDPPHPLARVLFTFSVAANAVPAVTVTSPTAGQEFRPGAPVPIAWTMSDPETALGDLIVYVNYSSSAGNGRIGGPLQGATSVTWIAPNIDAGDVRIRVTVIDGNGVASVAVSQPFAIRPAFDLTLIAAGVAAIAAVIGILLFVFLRLRRREAPPTAPPPEVEAPPPTISSQPVAPPPPPASTTKRCPQCGTAVDAGDAECFRCGHRF